MKKSAIYNRKNLLAIICLFGIASFYTISCHTYPKGVAFEGLQLQDSTPRVNFHSTTNSTFIDSLRLNIHLNDTVFSLSRLKAEHAKWHPKDYNASATQQSSVDDSEKCPILNVEFVNVCSSSFFLPVKNFYSPRPKFESYKDFRISLGPLDNDSGKSHCNYPIVEHNEAIIFMKRYLQSLAPRQVFNLPDSFNVLSVYSIYLEECTFLDTGRYWLFVQYSNFLTVDTVPPVWTGTVKSDTLWFRITE